MIAIEGLTEDEVVKIIYKACKTAIKYKFGYLSGEDLVAHSVVKCVKVLNEGKFIPRSEKPIEAQLLNFLSMVSRNEASNLRRKHSCRYSNPENRNNEKKYNLAHPLKIHSQGLTNSELFSEESTMHEEMNYSELMIRIRETLPIPMLKDFLKWTNGVKLSTTKKKILLDTLKEILSAQKTHQSSENE